MTTKPSISSLVGSQLPEFIREDHTTFVAFLQAYYDYLETQSPDIKDLGDIDDTLDSFVQYFKNEFASNLPTTTVDERFLIQHIKEQYLSKGSESSFNFLFRLLFNKDVVVEYPATQMLRASDGRWNKDISLRAEVTDGQPSDVVGKTAAAIDTVSGDSFFVLVERSDYVEVNTGSAIIISPDIYEFIINRRYTGTISVGDVLTYSENGINFQATIVSTTSTATITTPGTGFKVGDIFYITDAGDGYGSALKVTKVGVAGEILRLEFVKFGVNYTSNFTATLTPKNAGTNATIAIGLDALGNYPGYYTSNAGFLDDAIYIQDSKYYQAFSYVLKVDELLDSYKSAVKSLVHPSGMAMFGQYDIQNTFSVGQYVEAMIKYLTYNLQDEIHTSVSIINYDMTKLLEDAPVITDASAYTLTKYITDDTDPLADEGFLLLNPYALAGYFQEVYAGTPTNF
jgi:hypothetical protein